VVPGPDDEDQAPDSAEVRAVRVDLASIPDFAEDVPDFSEASSSQSKELPPLPPELEERVEIEVPDPDRPWEPDLPDLDDEPVLGAPAPELAAPPSVPVFVAPPMRGARRATADGGHEPSEPLPVLGAEHEVWEELPVLGAEHELSEELPVLGAEHEVSEELPVLGAEHEVSEELPVLGAEHEVSEELPVLGAEHEVSEELPVLGAEHEVSEEPPVDRAEPAAREEPADLDAERRAADDAQAMDDLPSDQPDADADADADAEDATTADDAEASRNYRQIYETEIRPLEPDARIAMAQTADGSLLLALCLDADPKVIRAVIERSVAGLDHARMIARHHRNPVGLELVVQRVEFARDPQVQRLLVRNNQLTESLLRRLVGQRPLRELYKLSIDREVAERNRVGTRGLLRTRWASAPAEDRAALVLGTEARCLAVLIGSTFDSRTTSILCSKPMNSVLMIQNLARFPACPPALLVHLLKQPFVRKSPALKKLIFQHPNLPSQAKRSL
jgi:hypothetical protein